jgi:putative heme degradation protein
MRASVHLQDKRQGVICSMHLKNRHSKLYAFPVSNMRYWLAQDPQQSINLISHPCSKQVRKQGALKELKSHWNNTNTCSRFYKVLRKKTISQEVRLLTKHLLKHADRLTDGEPYQHAVCERQRPRPQAPLATICFQKHPTPR